MPISRGILVIPNERNTHANEDGDREVLQLLSDLLLERLAAGLVRAEVDVARGDDTLLALQCADDLDGELGASVRHRERRGPRAVLRLHDFVAAELDARRQGLELF